MKSRSYEATWFLPTCVCGWQFWRPRESEDEAIAIATAMGHDGRGHRVVLREKKVTTIETVGSTNEIDQLRDWRRLLPEN